MNHHKILSFDELNLLIKNQKNNRPTIIFTNGCFDLFHAGHSQLLSQLRENTIQESLVIVGVNSDKSVKLNKGEFRPIIPQEQRAYVVANHEEVDYVFIFDEQTIEKYLKLLQPNYWCKGGDYTEEDLHPLERQAKGAAIFKSIPFLEGVSATKIINKILSLKQES
jgi:rfaE bifunctional protein nucleotidyltransferase chain/domain